MFSDRRAFPEASPKILTRHALFVLGVALLARALVVCYVSRVYPPAWFFSRGLEIGLTADSIVKGLGLSSPFGPTATGPTAMIAPGYPLLVAAVFRLLGSYSRASEIALLSISTAWNVATVWLILTVGRRIAGEMPAVLAALLWGCSLPLIWMPTIFWETSLSALLLLSSVALALSSRGRSGPDAAIAHGLLCGLGGLVNPALLPSLLAIAACSIARHAFGKRRALQALAVFALIFAPWPIRNAKVFHAWIPTRTTVGFELWMGNHLGASGFLEQNLFPTYNPAEFHSYREQGEVAYMNGKARLARASIQAHPFVFLRLTDIRIFRFWTGSGSRPGSPFFVLHGLLTTTLGLAGLVVLFRSRQLYSGVICLLPVLLFPLPYYITHAEFRYRLVLDPVLTLLSAAAVQAGLAWQRAAVAEQKYRWDGTGAEIGAEAGAELHA